MPGQTLRELKRNPGHEFTEPMRTGARVRTGRVIYNGHALKILAGIYEKLYAHFGPQHWWPGDTPLEVAVGAVLTQNTNWGNVERAISNLKRAKALSARRLHDMPKGKLASLIRPAGYFNVKAGRLKSFVGFLVRNHGGSMKRMGRTSAPELREELLGVKGIGPETADSILLYALGKPVFVIDAYTKRVLSRHGVMEQGGTYDEFQALFHRCFENPVEGEDRVAFFNEYHALFVAVGKTFCRPKAPLCGSCPLRHAEN